MILINVDYNREKYGALNLETTYRSLHERIKGRKLNGLLSREIWALFH